MDWIRVLLFFSSLLLFGTHDHISSKYSFLQKSTKNKIKSKNDIDYE